MSERFSEWKKPYIDRQGWAYPDYHSSPYNLAYGWRCQHPDGLKLGDRVDIGCFTYMNAYCGIIICDDVQIGSHCSIYSHDTENNKKGSVVIGKGALIGSHSTILPGAKIPDKKKIPAYSLIYEKYGRTKICVQKRKWEFID